VDLLERQGLVRRVPSPTDRRVIYIDLTQVGETRFEELGPAMAESLEEVLSVLSASEREALSTSTRQLRNRAADRLHLSRQVFEDARPDEVFSPRVYLEAARAQTRTRHRPQGSRIDSSAPTQML